MTEKIIAFVTAPDEDSAAMIGRTLVEERLAACANIVRGIRSIYRWKGEIFDEQECLLVIKAASYSFPKLEERVRSMHPYEVPEIIAIEISHGSRAYLDWITENTRLG